MAVIGGGIALMLAMIVVGVLAWWAPPPKWTAVVLVVGAPLGFLPEVQQIAVIVFAAAGLITLARRSTTPPDLSDTTSSMQLNTGRTRTP